MSSPRLRTLLICHHDAPLHHDGMARWLASWSELTGIVILEERRSLLWRRLRREARRVGALRLLDVLAFRLYYKATLAGRDAAWMESALADLRSRYPAIPPSVSVIRSHSTNTPEVESFVRQHAPDMVLALAKQIIRPGVFTIPTHGTFVLHPGICPEYRNAHGCFWALASRDLSRVGMTLLRIDRGVDTGPIFGYFSYPYDERVESHIVIQHRVVIDNLPAIAERLRSIAAGTATSIPVTGRSSGEWGQPWLSQYLRWQRAAKRVESAPRHA
jgi:folate-dependent phosphoribosylglycinamide formyltransferase PurN